jgi:hypothetical protein
MPFDGSVLLDAGIVFDEDNFGRRARDNLHKNIL